MAINSISSGASGQMKTSNSLIEAQSMALQGIKNQNFRFKIISENLTNSDSTAKTPGGDPYRRKQVVFEQKNDPKVGTQTVQVKSVIHDKSEFLQDYDPSHPAADEKGLVKKPNVNRVIETVDMITAKNTQKALLKAYAEGTSMRRMQIDLMR